MSGLVPRQYVNCHVWLYSKYEIILNLCQIEGMVICLYKCHIHMDVFLYCIVLCTGNIYLHTLLMAKDSVLSTYASSPSMSMAVCKVAMTGSHWMMYCSCSWMREAAGGNHVTFYLQGNVKKCITFLYSFRSSVKDNLSYMKCMGDSNSWYSFCGICKALYRFKKTKYNTLT